MRACDAKVILRYLGDIKGQLRAVNRELNELEGDYDGRGSINYDGMPHGSAPGDNTAQLAVKMAESGAKRRMEVLLARREELQGDAGMIRMQTDRLRAVYKTVLFEHYVYNHSWVKTSIRIRQSEATAKRKGYEGLQRLAELLEELPMAEELLARARVARD